MQSTNRPSPRLRRIAVAMLTVGLLATAMAAPAAAAGRDQEELPIAYLIIDEVNGLLGFVNVNRTNRCAWSGPPEPYPANDTVAVRFNELNDGVLMVSYNAVVSFELWHLDTGSYDASQGPCGNTDGHVAPFAIGMARVNSSDNDFTVSGTRGNAFGETGTANVYEPSGRAWHYSWTFRGLGIPPEDCACRVLVDRHGLRPRG